MADLESTKDNEDLELDIDRLAREEILKDAKKAKARTETMGAVGWQACPLPPTNKRFLRNMIFGTLSSSKNNNSHEGQSTVKQRKRRLDDEKLNVSTIRLKQGRRTNQNMQHTNHPLSQQESQGKQRDERTSYRAHDHKPSKKHRRPIK